ncbi:hypothetical protein SDC9_176858 [bioreactor metagenome]|uniref:Uncharacterized protein n=1 Tax=bioreactor metagenome TaxID=1076179 RepID=A0A645GRN8_9ZZZZ
MIRYVLILLCDFLFFCHIKYDGKQNLLVVIFYRAAVDIDNSGFSVFQAMRVCVGVLNPGQSFQECNERFFLILHIDILDRHMEEFFLGIAIKIGRRFVGFNNAA